jgi:hypothetical protein
LKEDDRNLRLLLSFREIFERGSSLLRKSGYREGNFEQLPSLDEYLGFRSSAMGLISRTLGTESEYYKEMARIVQLDKSQNSYYLSSIVGIFEAAKRDIEEGIIFDVRALIAAELLGDFMEQATELLKAGYFVPAASLAGAVLEDGLRKLCEKHRIEIPERPGINKLNSELYRNNVYNKLINKRITSIADIRNNADHGHADEFKMEDVDEMLKWIERFFADYLN